MAMILILRCAVCRRRQAVMPGRLCERCFGEQSLLADELSRLDTPVPA